MRHPSLKWIARAAVVLAVLYATLFCAVGLAMLQTPQRFGRFMSHMPEPVVWGLLPAPSMWLWARQGNLKEGDVAPDFTLPLQDSAQEVTLSSHQGLRPVVLVFGSYT